jgi:DNA topoisomerase III
MSIPICRKFLSEHSLKKAEGETAGKLDSKPVSPAQMLYAKKIAQGKGVVVPEETKVNSAAMSAWIDSNRSAKRRKRGRKTAYKPAGSVAPQSTATTKRSRKRKADTAAAPLASTQPNSVYWYAAADSLWQQGGRSEAWGPISLGWMVCPTWS